MKVLTRVLLLSSLVVPATAFAADTYTIDPNHTAVVWSISHFGFSNPNGKFYQPEGTLVLDQEKPENSKVNVTFKIDNLTTGVVDLDKHLKSKDFFDAEQFPTATYVSDKVEVTGDDTAIVHGNLTLHGVTKPVDLNVKLNKIGDNFKNMPTAGFDASAVIKRSDFGISAYLPALGDEVKLAIQSEANILPAEKDASKE